jgi:hypothetical protein
MEKLDYSLLIEDRYELIDIKSIKKETGKFKMCDIEVEDDHTFCISKENIISHNCNNLVKGCTIPALISDASIIFINHVYADPSAMYASKIKTQSGGKGLQYVSSITIQCDRRVEKSEGEEDTYYKGSNLKFFCTKNRLIKPFYETEVYIDFNKGIGKYNGLLEPAIQYGFIKDEGVKNGYYIIPSWVGHEDELIKKTNIFNEEYDDAWKSFLNDFNEKSKADMLYSSKEFNDMIAIEQDEVEFEEDVSIIEEGQEVSEDVND